MQAHVEIHYREASNEFKYQIVGEPPQGGKNAIFLIQVVIFFRKKREDPLCLFEVKRK